MVIAETAHGRVEGRREQDALVFRGIPYAAPPVGEGRWRAPRPPRPWSGVLDARRSAPVSPQHPGLVSRALGSPPEETSEACLALNVWTPGLRGVRPVMVWLHGGGFTTGSGSLPVYDGGVLARRGDVVVVTLNYRLGALGFLALPEATRRGEADANCGLRDQLAALEWVRDNVAAFGGDPAQVTLFGQSAGAMCVGALLGVPRARGLFARAILQSGAARNVHDPATAARVTRVFLEEAGVAGEDLGALRALPAEQLLGAQRATQERLRGEVGDLAFQPVVDGDLLSRPPLDAVASGSARDVALLVGTNRDEWRFWGLGDPAARDLDEAGLLERVRRSLPGPDGRALAQRVVETYRASRAGRPGDLWFAIQTDRWFRHPAARLAELQATHRADTRSYLFTWESPGFGGVLGACHALEIPFVFGSRSRGGVRDLVGDGAAAARLADRMQGCWLSFARGEAPAHPELPAWPGYAAEGRATMVLGRECSVTREPAERERAVWDEIAGIIPA